MKRFSGTIATVLRSFDDGRQRAELYRSWRVGASAGLTHTEILGRLGPYSGSTALLHERLLAGAGDREEIASMVRLRPALFEPFEAALLSAAEESGSLERVLGELAEFFERQYRMMLVIKRRLVYPLFVTFVAIFLLPLPLIFQGQGRAYLATVIIGLVGWIVFGGSVLAGRARAYQMKPALVRARFARTLMLTLRSGLPVGRALKLAAAASGDPALVKHLARADERTLSTRSLEDSLSGAPGLTPDFFGTLRVAERTGDLSSTLGRLADLYEDGFR